MTEKKRWQYRFDNFRRALNLLREGLEAFETGTLSQLEREGLIQRFEYTWDLAWKTLSDYLANEGIVVEAITPRSVIKAAYAANVISRGRVWMSALDARNRMSHTYNFAEFERVLTGLHATYFELFDELNDYLTGKVLEDGAL